MSTASPSAADIEYDLLRRFAAGDGAHLLPVRCDAYLSETGLTTDAWRACRRVALWAETFAEILRTGAHHSGLPATNGLFVSEIRTKQRGSLLFVENPDFDHAVTGSVFPYLPEITLGPREVFVWAHDVPLGASASYLGAYAGLVKSDARVLFAHIRPDPYPGVRVYVYGEPGETREVVLFNEGRGESLLVTFANAPQIYSVGPSQVVALTTEMAGRTWFAADENAPVLLGADNVREHTAEYAVIEAAPENALALYALYPDGTVTPLALEPPVEPFAAPDFEDTDWRELDAPTSRNRLGGPFRVGWYRATVHTDEAFDAELQFDAFADRLTLWVNGERLGASDDGTATFDLRLKPGINILAVRTEATRDEGAGDTGLFGPVTLIPSGGCYLLDIARWRFRGGTDYEAAGLPFPRIRLDFSPAVAQFG